MSWTTTPPREYGWYWCREEDDENQDGKIAEVFPDEGYYPPFWNGPDAKEFKKYPKTEWIHEAIPRPDIRTGDYGLGRSKIKCSFGGDHFEAEGPGGFIDQAFGAFMFALAKKHELPTEPEPEKEKPREPKPLKVLPKPAELEELPEAPEAYISWKTLVAAQLPKIQEPFARREMLELVLNEIEIKGLKKYGDPKSNVSQAISLLEKEGVVTSAGLGPGGVKLYRRIVVEADGTEPTEEHLLDLDQARSLIESGNRDGEEVAQLCSSLLPFGWAELECNLWTITEVGHREWTSFQERRLQAQGIAP